VKRNRQRRYAGASLFGAGPVSGAGVGRQWQRMHTASSFGSVRILKDEYLGREEAREGD
jgi:hypothetical protein